VQFCPFFFLFLLSGLSALFLLRPSPEEHSSFLPRLMFRERVAFSQDFVEKLLSLVGGFLFFSPQRNGRSSSHPGRVPSFFSFRSLYFFFSPPVFFQTMPQKASIEGLRRPPFPPLSSLSVSIEYSNPDGSVLFLIDLCVVGGIMRSPVILFSFSAYDTG